MLGSQDINVGDPEFDRKFWLRGSDAEPVQRLFSNPSFREQVSYCVGRKHCYSWIASGNSSAFLSHIAVGKVRGAKRLGVLSESVSTMMIRVARIDKSHRRVGKDPGLLPRA